MRDVSSTRVARLSLIRLKAGSSASAFTISRFGHRLIYVNANAARPAAYGDWYAVNKFYAQLLKCAPPALRGDSCRLPASTSRPPKSQASYARAGHRRRPPSGSKSFSPPTLRRCLYASDDCAGLCAQKRSTCRCSGPDGEALSPRACLIRRYRRCPRLRYSSAGGGALAEPTPPMGAPMREHMRC